MVKVVLKVTLGKTNYPSLFQKHGLACTVVNMRHFGLYEERRTPSAYGSESYGKIEAGNLNKSSCPKCKD